MTQADRVHSTPPTNTSANVDTSRRGFFAQAAAVVAGGAVLGAALPLPLPAATSQGEPDPILAAIELHRRAHQRHWASLGEDELEDAIPQERRLSSWYGAMHDEPDWRVLTDDPVWIAHIEEGVAASNAESDAACALVSILPTTPAGILALLQYAIEADLDGKQWLHELQDDHGKARVWHHFLIQNLAEILPALMRTSRRRPLHGCERL
jgi:hypothetical protein